MEEEEEEKEEEDEFTQQDHAYVLNAFFCYFTYLF
jgi:hypothetical protein